MCWYFAQRHGVFIQVGDCRFRLKSKELKWAAAKFCDMVEGARGKIKYENKHSIVKEEIITKVAEHSHTYNFFSEP